MAEQGYYRFPTIHDDTIVFVSEDDLWTVPLSGGLARRLTANPGRATHPYLSPDGSLLAYTGREEGTPEVYVMPAEGGPARRLTYLGADTWVAGWHPDGQSVLMASNTAQPIDRMYALYALPANGEGLPRLLPTGPAMSISYGPGGGVVIGRHTTDLARWKRYRGGLTGALWVDPAGSGEWRRLIELPGQRGHAHVGGARIYFLADHEGIANLYSCLANGEDLRRHTHQGEYYVRHPSTDGRRLVYTAGAELYVYDPATDASSMVPVDFRSPRTGCRRRYVDAACYLQGYAIHPNGHSVALISRGKPFTMGNWEGAPVQLGQPQGVRYRLPVWLHDGERLAVIGDATGEETIEVHPSEGNVEAERLEGLDIGRPEEMVASPVAAQVALSNHRHELLLVDLAARTARLLDHSNYERLQGLAWSPDGRWLAYGFPSGQQTCVIKLCRVETGETWEVTRPVLHDVAPAFDPDGRYLYFLSYRDFDPVYDNLHFDLNFPRGVRPYLITLQDDLRSPFVPVPTPLKKREPDHAADQEESSGPADADDRQDTEDDEEDAAGQDGELPKPVEIDVEGLADRLIAFPVSEGRYGQIWGLPEGKVIFSNYPIEGTLQETGDEPPAHGKLLLYTFEDQSQETLIDGLTDFEISLDGETLIYLAGERLRVLEAGKKPPEDEAEDDDDRPGRKSGWLDLERLRVAVNPVAEWAQMYREAWRLQRDQFWTSDMSGVDWLAVYRRYQPLLSRVGARSEFSDLLWEMQGELGTSHAFEMGGDYPIPPEYYPGFLGIDLAYDARDDTYQVAHIVRGDVWDQAASSPLARPGIQAHPGDRILAIDGQPVGRGTSPGELLVNQCGNEVLVTLTDADGSNRRNVTVKTLRSETPARYREWVNANRRRVHEATGGRAGYVHIPDMGERGYAEFHRGYLAEIQREGLIVDVRYNGGGYVSQLILEKLARRRLGYDVPRWGEPVPYPVESVAGPLVALTNELAGSDGDMFSHAFKLMGLGPLIGKRTWGGVIGIEVQDTLVDGGVTTQPEYSTWFRDVGWGLENYGTDPDIEVEIRPQDYATGQDPQLERAIVEVLQLMLEHPPLTPNLASRPRLSLPTLPGNGNAGE